MNDNYFLEMAKVEEFMAEALALAEKGRGRVWPNPMVGAVVVKDGRVIGRGWHEYYGGIHAEVMAIREAEKAGGCSGGVLLCTLEPCCFRSPKKHNAPCTEKVIEAGLKAVYVARLDVNPKVRGRGVEVLKKAGLHVETGVLEREAAELNRVYETIVLKARPYVHLKAALTMDGYMAAFDGRSNWISCEESRRRVMKLRAGYCAVLVGAGTVRADRPRLSVRGEKVVRKQPLRVILKGRGDIPADWPADSDGGGEVLMFVPEEGGPMNEAAFNGGTALWYRMSLEHVLNNLYERGIYSVLVEGGSKVFSSFLNEELWDRLTVFQSPDLLGGGLRFYNEFRGGGAEAGRRIDNKLCLYNRKSRWSGRDVEVTGDREEYSCLQV